MLPFPVLHVHQDLGPDHRPVNPISSWIANLFLGSEAFPSTPVSSPVMDGTRYGDLKLQGHCWLLPSLTTHLNHAHGHLLLQVFVTPCFLSPSCPYPFHSSPPGQHSNPSQVRVDPVTCLFIKYYLSPSPLAQLTLSGLSCPPFPPHPLLLEPWFCFSLLPMPFILPS